MPALWKGHSTCLKGAETHSLRIADVDAQLHLGIVPSPTETNKLEEELAWVGVEVSVGFREAVVLTAFVLVGSVSSVIISTSSVLFMLPLVKRLTHIRNKQGGKRGACQKSW